MPDEIMKYQILLLSSIMVFSGCLGGASFVCPDGSSVGDASLCAAASTTLAAQNTVEVAGVRIDSDCSKLVDGGGRPDSDGMYRCQLMKNASVEFCAGINGKYAQNLCLVEVASITNDTNVCSKLAGALKATCEAVAERDKGVCGRIPSDEQKKYCELAVSKVS
jgi:hypothetical protein